ncbi:MAG: hypothetical protein M0R06_03645 [Sphaerochaeta sp.]|jgi:hypothetical protein|nr:hypothetical protein [Sphaerochaeta sp.]
MEKTERFNLALTPEDKAALQHLAGRERLPAAAVVRRLIWDAVKGDAPARRAPVRVEGNFGQMANLPG